MKKSSAIILILFLSLQVFGQKIKFVRVCNGGNNNALSWQIISDTCTLGNTLKIYTRDAITFPYYGLDSGIICATKNYIHLNANIPGVKDWEYFLQYQIICGTDTFTRYSDTLKIDDQKPDSTILDSVSVDPLTNQVYLGWSSNRTPDFSSYYVYNSDRPDPRLIENYKDTFYTDINPINPKTKSLSYDITSSDSCDNRKDYGQYFHKTIFLQGSFDTCVNRASLSWTSYVGWTVRVYEIYKKTNFSAFVFLDSVSGSINQYLDNNINSSSTVEYFVRARKLDSQRPASSSSNATDAFTSSISVNPINTKILYVGNNLSEKLELKIERNSSSNYSGIDLFRIKENESPVFIYTFTAAENLYEDQSAINTIKYSYYVLSKNMCGIVTDSSANSNNIVLTIQKNNTDLGLSWSNYFTWNSGVKEYVIYRSTGNTVQEAINFTAINTLSADTQYSDPMGLFAVSCYYVEANEQGGSNKSRSNKACYIKTGNVFYPNAISVFGVNKTFTFKGEGIDLSMSSIQIYNRWGQLEFNKTNILDGWDGKNNAGEEVPGGVYFFTAQISQGNNIVNLHGNITVLK